MSKSEKVFKNFVKALFSRKDVKKIQISALNKNEVKIFTITLNKDMFL